jgi:hypothetical protein
VVVPPLPDNYILFRDSGSLSLAEELPEEASRQLCYGEGVREEATRSAPLTLKQEAGRVVFDARPVWASGAALAWAAWAVLGLVPFGSRRKASSPSARPPSFCAPRLLLVQSIMG